MRIICDHCSRPITGTVKRIAGNLNFHPDCLAERVIEGTKPGSTDATFRDRENHAARLLVNETG